MKRLITASILVAGAATFILALTASAQAPVDPRILAYDKGPDKIDVSSYPADMQKSYKLFTEKCSKCHTLARPINAEFVLEDEWERLLKRKLRLAGSFISPSAGKQIFEFLVYDSQVRKKDLYEKRLAEADAGTGS